ncbi:MAG: PEGA domain-containing protein [Myxococcota bacterium]
MGRAVVRMALCSVLVFSTLDSAAQNADNVAEARRLFEAGVAALDDSRFAEAADLLEQSLALRDSPSARFNRALALRGAGRYREAIEECDRTLSIATAARHRGLRQQATRMKDELASQLVHVELVAEGEPERIEVDGEVLARSGGTHQLVRDPGPLVITLRRDGYAPVEHRAELEAGARETVRLNAATSPLPARVVIRATPSEAVLRWDGRELGIGTASLEVPFEPDARHLVEVAAEGYEEQNREVVLGPGEEARLDFSLAEIGGVPIQRKWWFWALIIVGAGAAATTVGLIMRPDDSINEGDLGFAVEVLRVTP